MDDETCISKKTSLTVYYFIFKQLVMQFSYWLVSNPTFTFAFVINLHDFIFIALLYVVSLSCKRVPATIDNSDTNDDLYEQYLDRLI